MLRRVLCLVILFAVFPFIRTLSYIKAEPFTIVIDPGHGGKDPGALGSIVREKDVVLEVALRFGNLINKNNPDVKVIYTRSTDVFPPLEKRPQIANKAKANLFVSLHADWAESKTVRGASTFTLGQNRSKENLEIAKRENSVILLEDNYQQRYEGFDPNSAESYIMFEFMQDNYMNQSINFATILQNKFTNAGRYDRGVRQASFLVLRNTSMPSALVELGFLTNKEEELFLKSDEGKNKLANSLYNAFKEFKDDYDRKSVLEKEIGNNSVLQALTNIEVKDSKTDDTTSKENNTDINISKSDNTEKSKTEKTDNNIIFKIQLLLSSKLIPDNDKLFKGLKMDFYIDKGNYKYTFGSWTNFSDADKKRIELTSKFKDAFIVAFKNDQRMPLNEARKQLQ